MDPYTMFLLSMQAAGVVTSIWEAKGAQSKIQQGRSLEKAGIEMNMAANNYEFQESSLASMRELRTNLGAQAVMNAARGNASGTEGTAVQTGKSVSATGGDVEAKRMRMLAREADLRASNILSGLHTLKSETDLGRQLSSNIFEAASTGVRQFQLDATTAKQTKLLAKFASGGA